MTLFQRGDFKLHSGAASDFKIECDALDREDWACLAFLLAQRLPPFEVVEGVPRGGKPLADELAAYTRDSGGLLIVDDVWTTGGSMETFRAGRDAIGAVVFARSRTAPWVTPLFFMAPPSEEAFYANWPDNPSLIGSWTAER